MNRPSTTYYAYMSAKSRTVYEPHRRIEQLMDTSCTGYSGGIMPHTILQPEVDIIGKMEP